MNVGCSRAGCRARRRSGLHDARRDGVVQGRHGCGQATTEAPSLGRIVVVRAVLEQVRVYGQQVVLGVCAAGDPDEFKREVGDDRGELERDDVGDAAIRQHENMDDGGQVALTPSRYRPSAFPSRWPASCVQPAGSM